MPEYHITDQDLQDLQNRFSYHAPKDGQPARYVKIRERAFELALLIKQNTPVGRQQSLALTALEEVTMRANAAIAQGE